MSSNRATLLFVCLMLAAAAGIGLTQPPSAPAPVAPPVLVAPSPQVPALPEPFSPPQPSVLVAPGTLVPDAPSTLDQLIERLTQVRAQKAELERQEKALVEQLKQKLHQYREHLNKLGITDAPAGDKELALPPVGPASK
jgi:hypothetical protein